MRYAVRKLKQGENIPTHKSHHRRIAKGGEWAIVNEFDEIVMGGDTPEVYTLKSAAVAQREWLTLWT